MKVLGLGDNVYDVYQNLHISYPGGNAVNVAVNGAKLGYESAYLGSIADDCYGYHMKTVLNSENVDISHCQIIPHTTTKRCIENVYDGERQFINVDLGKNWVAPIQLSSEDIEYIKTFDIILTSCNAKIEDQICQLKNIQGIVSYDFGEKDKYRHSEYLKKILPYVDLVQFSMNHATYDDIKEMITTYSIKIPMLITRGSETPLFYSGKKLIEGNLHYVKPVDTMGAGDAYITAFVCSLVQQGWKKGTSLKDEWIEKAMEKASVYAADVCMINGGFGCPYQKKDLKAVIFDMDGVIVDSEAHWQNIFENIVKSYGKTISKEDKKEFYGCSYEKEIEILSRYIDLSSEEIMKIRKEFSNAHPIEYHKHLIEGVSELIYYLKSQHIKLVIASSSLLQDIQKMVKDCGFGDVFDLIISGEMFEESKPNPAIYNYAIERLSIDKKNIFVIEDSKYGVEAGYLAGLDVLALRNSYYTFNLDYANLKFNSHKDILEFIKKVIIREEE